MAECIGGPRADSDRQIDHASTGDGGERSTVPGIREDGPGVTVLSAVGSRISSMLSRPMIMTMGTGLLAGALTGAGVVASTGGLNPLERRVSLLGCPGGGAVLARIPEGTTVLVTARSPDGAWLKVYVGEPGIDGAWAPRSAVRLSEVADQLPMDDCGAAAASALPPTPAPTPSPTPEPTPLPIDACAALDQQQAEAIAGTPLGPAQTPSIGGLSCTYAGPVDGPEAQVSIFIGDGAKGTYDTDRSLNHQFRRVPGIGDEAWLEDYNIFFREGTTWVAIELVRLNDPRDNDQRLIDAATAIAAAWPS
jgi:hypothetical protein